MTVYRLTLDFSGVLPDYAHDIAAPNPTLPAGGQQNAGRFQHDAERGGASERIRDILVNAC